jgi:Sulfotransferase family
MDIDLPVELFEDWMPVRVLRRRSGVFVDWCYLGRARFIHPFFDITVQKEMSRPFNMLFHHQTPIEYVERLNESAPSVRPTGFIFHMSRCGSTLVSQMLAALPQNIVISEASPINGILQADRSDPGLSEETRIRRLRAIIGALGRKRFAGEKHYFVKFDSWNSFDLELVRRAFPEVPWIFLYREPLEVIVSQMRERGGQMVPGALGHFLPGTRPAETWQMPPEEYCARVLERFCENAIEEIERDATNALLINYEQLPQAMAASICPHFGLEYLPEDEEKMTAAARRDAKNPNSAFQPDSKKKRDEASEAALAAVERLRPLHKKLEDLRAKTGAAG